MDTRQQKLGHTDQFILRFLDRSITGVTPEQLVKAKYKNSKQPEIKARTFKRYMISLRNQGLLIQFGNTFVITNSGRTRIK